VIIKATVISDTEITTQILIERLQSLNLEIMDPAATNSVPLMSIKIRKYFLSLKQTAATLCS
jgi:hypothetical protein